MKRKMIRLSTKILIALLLLLAMLIPVAGYTADVNEELISAAGNGDVATVKALLAKGADVNAKGNRGRTALIGAAERGYTDTVKVLLDKGADVNWADDRG